MTVRLLLAALVLAVPVAGVQVPDLQKFFYSTNGLDMSSQDSEALAKKEAPFLTACRVTVPDLQALRDTLYSSSRLDLSKPDVRTNLFPLAYQHAGPTDLSTLFQGAYSSSGLDLSKSQAQSTAMGLALKHAQAELMRPIFQALYSSSGVDLSKSQAQQLAIDLTAAGADPDVLKSTFRDAYRTQSKEVALQKAIPAAVAANLQGLVKRYSKDGKAYTAAEFQQYFGAQWLTEWQVAPQEKRTAQDGIDYRASEFLQYFGAASWASRYQAAPVAVQNRIASDTKTYTMAEFQKFYGATWQTEWAKAYEVPDLCAGLNQATCNTQSKCQWKWTGDWTTSCVVRPLSSMRAQAADLVV